MWKGTTLWFPNCNGTIYYHNWHKVHSLWGSQHVVWKNSLGCFVHVPRCVISRCQICNYSSLFIRIWPDAYQRDRFAFLGPFARSVKDFSLLLRWQCRWNCIVSEAFLTPKQGHRKYSLRTGSWEETESTERRQQVNSWISHFCCSPWSRHILGFCD